MQVLTAAVATARDANEDSRDVWRGCAHVPPLTEELRAHL